MGIFNNIFKCNCYNEDNSEISELVRKFDNSINELNNLKRDIHTLYEKARLVELNLMTTTQDIKRLGDKLDSKCELFGSKMEAITLRLNDR